ncbi:ABA4-like family protein [Sphingomonas sp. AX6]|uniref:ABA4-like family protein n=1 Tax=Sphingomonas sp. AX6 TaxID=2653171 RepID=UPI0012F38AFF|nr:ABA4-like family protein [Sphingomonas sp. AX6]VXC87233.1 TetR family transcriptional regulator [Sphingomonas sp. AX6]
MDMWFSIANLATLCGWALLIATVFSERLRAPGWAIAGRWLPAAFAVTYLALIATSLWGGDGDGGGGFDSLGSVRALFGDDRALMAGWLHYLAFDLFVGRWIAERGVARGRSPVLLIPAMLLTFLLGPVGLLAALLLGLFKRGEAG